jgi:hypothetical protein
MMRCIVYVRICVSARLFILLIANTLWLLCFRCNIDVCSFTNMIRFMPYVCYSPCPVAQLIGGLMPPDCLPLVPPLLVPSSGLDALDLLRDIVLADSS